MDTTLESYAFVDVKDTLATLFNRYAWDKAPHAFYYKCRIWTMHLQGMVHDCMHFLRMSMHPERLELCIHELYKCHTFMKHGTIFNVYNSTL